MRPSPAARRIERDLDLSLVARCNFVRTLIRIARRADMLKRCTKRLVTCAFALLVVGGLHSFHAYADASDSVARWVATGDLNVARTYHTATLLADGRVLVVGGTGSDGSILDSAELYDPAVRTWKTTGKLALGRTGHAAVRLQNGRV